MTKFSEWLRLHEATVFLAYGCSSEHLDAWAYPGASVGLDFTQACQMHPAWYGDRELPPWMRQALYRSGKLRGSSKPNAPSLSSILHALKREIYRREINRHDDVEYGSSNAVFDELTSWRQKLLRALGEDVLTSYGISGEALEKGAAAPVPAEVYRAPTQLTPDGKIRCGLATGELILWRDVVVRTADVDQHWPASDDGPSDGEAVPMPQRVEPMEGRGDEDTTPQQPGTIAARGRSFRAKDAEHLATMSRLIASGEAKHPTDAARILVCRGVVFGKGTDDSKIKRLQRLFRDA